MNQKGFAQIILLPIILIGILVGVVLVQQETNIFSQASGLGTIKVTNNDLVNQEKKTAGIDANGKLVIKRAQDLAVIVPKNYQRLVQQGLIANPNLIKSRHVQIQGGGGGIITPPSVNTCGDITSNGNYSLTADITSQNICINIHDTNNVNLDCQNHIITSSGDTALIVTNVQKFSIKNCTIRATGIPLNILNSNSGSIQNNTIQGAYTNVYSSNNLQISNNTFNVVYQQISSSFNQIHDNQFKANTMLYYSPPAVVISNNGNNNNILNNTIDGSWDSIDHASLTDYKGADDGIGISWESEDKIFGNIISNNWDCGIETSGFIKNAQIMSNKINNSGLCGIGGWYWHSWIFNTIDSNIINKAAYAFYMFRAFGLDQNNNETNVYFKNNTFTNNQFSNQRVYSYVGPTNQYSGLLDFQNISFGIPPSAVQLGNNVFKDNDFNQTISSPILIPTSMIVDLGGNKCLSLNDPLRPLRCNTQVPSPTVSPTPTPAPSPTSTPKPSPTSSPYKRVFITSTLYNGNLGGVVGANRSCQDRANTAKLGGVWKAWISDTTSSPATSFIQNNGYKTLDGTIIADSWKTLTSGTLSRSIFRDEYGYFADRVVRNVWTSTTINGSFDRSQSNCNNWTSDWSDGNAYNGGFGQDGVTDSSWTQKDSDICIHKLHLYCFEQ